MSFCLILSEVQNDLIYCEHHLTYTRTKGTDLESYLTQFLLVRICGKFEKEIERVVGERAHKFGDSELARYIEGNFESYRHLKFENLRGKILKKFGTQILNNFDQQVKGQAPQFRYENIVVNRDASAHGGTLHITFDELKTSLPDAIKVLDAFENVLK